MTEIHWDTTIENHEKGAKRDDYLYALRGLNKPHIAYIGEQDKDADARNYGYTFWYNVRAQGHTGVTGPAKSVKEAQHQIVVQLLRWDAITHEDIPTIINLLPLLPKPETE